MVGFDLLAAVVVGGEESHDETPECEKTHEGGATIHHSSLVRGGSLLPICERASSACV